MGVVCFRTSRSMISHVHGYSALWDIAAPTDFIWSSLRPMPFNRSLIRLKLRSIFVVV